MLRRALDRVVRSVGFALLGSATFFCCCGTHPRVAPEALSAPLREAAPLSSAVGASEAEVRRAIAEIADLRGWSQDLAVGVRRVPSSAIREAMLADVRHQIPPGEQVAQTQLLAAFGWVPLGFDFNRDVLARFSREVAGLYSVTGKQVLLEWHADPKSIERTLRHELVHAFQDARYGLATRTLWHPDRGDYIAAIHSLAEGEATCIELALEDPRRLGCRDPALAAGQERSSTTAPDASLPAAIRDALMAPYSEGVPYVRRLLEQGGWSAVEHAWNGGLQSTGQLRRDSARPLELLPLAADLPGALTGCALQYLDSLGEQGVRALIGAPAALPRFDWVMQQLRGDRAAVWHCPRAHLVAFRWRFAETIAASEFAQLLGGAIGLSAEAGVLHCRSFARRTVALHQRTQDIAIASVLPRHGQLEGTTADTCPLLSEVTVRLAEL